MATLEDVTKIMAFLSALWPKEPVTKPTIKAYYKILQDLPPDALEAAAEQMAGSQTFFPKAAELRTVAFDLIQGDELPLPMECWQQVLDCWSGKHIEFHPLTTKTVNALGGMRRLGNTRDDEMPFLRGQFIKTCETYRKREVDSRRELPTVTKYKQLQSGRVDDAIQKLLEGKRVESPPDSWGELPY